MPVPSVTCIIVFLVHIFPGITLVWIQGTCISAEVSAISLLCLYWYKGWFHLYKYVLPKPDYG